MAAPRVLIFRAAGINCDRETEYAWTLAGAAAERIHLHRVGESPRMLDQFQILTLPGGFSYGDDIAAGKVFAVQLRRMLLDEIRRFVDRGGLIIGICNGFQILVKAGLLPNAHAEHPRTVAAIAHPGSVAEIALPPAFASPNLACAPGSDRDCMPEKDFAATNHESAALCTVTYNNPPGFQDRWVTVRAGQSNCAFTERGRTYEMPIAHGEGRVLFRDAATESEIVKHGLGVLTYVQGNPESGLADKPANPNGSAADIAGMCDHTGRVFGLMPHPERFVDWTQHPCWTSRPRRAHGDGLAIFQRAIANLR